MGHGRRHRCRRRALIIGAGVAGLAAVAAAKTLGAEVRAFDTRKGDEEQVERARRAKFLGGDRERGARAAAATKEMSPAFIAAEMALFKQQASGAISSSRPLIPGKKAPTLIKEGGRRRHEARLRHRRSGGGARRQLRRLTVPNQVNTTDNGVIVVGLTDLRSRMGASASPLPANNIVHLDEASSSTEGKVHWDLGTT